MAGIHALARGPGRAYMRLIRFGCAMSLDGYIAGPSGEYDWIVMDPDFDFSEHMAQFDTFLIGRKTFEAMRQMGADAPWMPGTHMSSSRAR